MAHLALAASVALASLASGWTRRPQADTGPDPATPIGPGWP